MMKSNNQLNNITKVLGLSNNKIHDLEIVNLQNKWYNAFFYRFHKTKNNSGLGKVLHTIFPIEIKSNVKNKILLIQYIDYFLGVSNLTPDQTRMQGNTFSIPLILLLDISLIDKTKPSSYVKNELVYIYIGNIPLITNKGSFIINGIERTIINQLHRSPGLHINTDSKYGPILQLIPLIGPWLQILLDKDSNLNIRIHRQGNIPLIRFFNYLDYQVDMILECIFNPIIYTKEGNDFILQTSTQYFKNKTIVFNIIDRVTRKNILTKNTIINRELFHRLSKSKISIQSIINNDHIIHLLQKGFLIFALTSTNGCNSIHIFNNTNSIKRKYSNPINKLYIIHPNELNSTYKQKLILSLTNQTHSYYTDSAESISKNVINNNSKLYVSDFKQSIISMMFNQVSYNLTDFGRINLNMKLNKNTKYKHLEKDDILQCIRLYIHYMEGIVDNHRLDIDILPNRIIRKLDDLFQDIFLSSFNYTKNSIQNKIITIQENNYAKLIKLIDFSTVYNNLVFFYNTSSLSQFTDQINSLSELSHKRKITMLGSDGLSQQMATMQNRDINLSYYGKLCPIETPEGYNVGLVNSYTLLSKINHHGLIKTPYSKVTLNGKITNNILYISSIIEYYYVISNKNTNIIKDDPNLRYNNKIINLQSKYINFNITDYKSIFSLCTTLIPFIEHNDASRTLMGANMQRQAIPLIYPENSIINTSTESFVTHNSNNNILSPSHGIVNYVDSRVVEIQTNLKYIYINLFKFKLLNNDSCLNQTPLVSVNQEIRKNQLIIESNDSYNGVLSLGTNLKVAYMSFGGYSFEDSIVISDRVLKYNLLTSITSEKFYYFEEYNHRYIELFNIDRNVPVSTNISPYLVKLGQYIYEKDRLFSKLRIFKINNILKDNIKIIDLLGDYKIKHPLKIMEICEYVPKNKNGVVTQIDLFSKNTNNNINYFNSKINKTYANNLVVKKILKMKLYITFQSILIEYLNKCKDTILSNNNTLSRITLCDILKNCNYDINYYKIFLYLKYRRILLKHINNSKYKDFKTKVVIGDRKLIKIQTVNKHSIKPGDKLTGRYGNKGIVARILPEKDMPYLSDGTYIDIILNPLGISSRMNIGQILETQLNLAIVHIFNQFRYFNEIFLNDVTAWSYKKYENNFVNYFNFKNPRNYLSDCLYPINNISLQILPFKHSTYNEINIISKIANFQIFNQHQLKDGKTGISFDRKITTGYIYISKLNHLVDSKIHARSIGPYNLISKQPLVGKSQLGGQRFGEMEVWSLEAYGTAYTLQEMLNIKSDSYIGKQYIDSILDYKINYNNLSVPESFNVLLRELWSLSLNLKYMK